MDVSNVRVYGYRWVVLLVFMFINITIQILWICYAPVTVEAAQYYHVSNLNIGLLAMIFMIVYIPLAIPAARAIDTCGLKKAVGFGAILLGVFGLLRGHLHVEFRAEVLADLKQILRQRDFYYLAFAWIALISCSYHSFRASSGRSRSRAHDC